VKYQIYIAAHVSGRPGGTERALRIDVEAEGPVEALQQLERALSDLARGRQRVVQ
jgi:hypothetical protein